MIYGVPNVILIGAVSGPRVYLVRQIHRQPRAGSGLRQNLAGMGGERSDRQNSSIEDEERDAAAARAVLRQICAEPALLSGRREAGPGPLRRAAFALRGGVPDDGCARKRQAFQRRRSVSLPYFCAIVSISNNAVKFAGHRGCKKLSPSMAEGRQLGKTIHLALAARYEIAAFCALGWLLALLGVADILFVAWPRCGEIGAKIQEELLPAQAGQAHAHSNPKR